jgi:hypothetical protein
MLSLDSRPLSASNGTLLVSLSSGRIQVWSHHDRAECCITDFDAIHAAGDVSKWLIDVHCCTLILMHSTSHSSVSLSMRAFFRAVHFAVLCDGKKNSTKQFYFQRWHFGAFPSLVSGLLIPHPMSVTAMTSDTQNCYLFTGSAKGYIKAWLIADFWYVHRSCIRLQVVVAVAVSV